MKWFRRGAISSSRPEHNNLRPSVAQGRLALTPAGNDLRILRKIYHRILGSQQSTFSRVITERESVTFLSQLRREPEGFLEGAERYALSIIFTATYGFRLIGLRHPVVVELYSIWDRLLRCKALLTNTWTPEPYWSLQMFNQGPLSSPILSQSF